jgi:hypothetical protein
VGPCHRGAWGADAEANVRMLALLVLLVLLALLHHSRIQRG